jgi:hypothetical protein
VKISPIKDIGLKARFSDPPAPPPQQPLPAKPDAASSLRRSDTERPKTGSPVRPDAQMSSLNEALASAKKEIELQGVRLRDLEAMLGDERRAREDAEERANQLEREKSKKLQEDDLELVDEDIHENGVESSEAEENMTGLENGSPSTTTADTTSRLQQRLELMVTEMNEMKQQMERYRERAETAEADRKSLAEMIETIRRDNARASSREARRQSRSNSQSAREAAISGASGSEDDRDAEEGEITIIKDKDLDEDGTEELLRRATTTTSNGHVGSNEKEKSSTDPSNALITQLQGRSDFMYHGGPVGAMISVVAIGVAVMAMLNQYPKAER